MARGVSLEDLMRCLSTCLFDPTARASIVPSEETVANMVPCVDRTKPVMTQSLCGDSTTFKSNRRMVLSRDADAKNEPSGENWTATTAPACPWYWRIRLHVRASQTSQEEWVESEPTARFAESGEKDSSHRGTALELTSSNVVVEGSLGLIVFCFLHVRAFQTERSHLM